MKFEEFTELTKRINNQNFNKSYKNINNVLLFLSYFGHLASIFLAYFMLSKILNGAIDNPIASGITSIVILTTVELLKRDIFNKFSILYLKVKSITKDVAPLFILSILIIGISFYSSISGANEYSSKSDKIENDSKNIINKYSDSITNIYNIKLNKLDLKLNKYEIERDSKKQEETILTRKLQEGELTKSEKDRVKQIRIDIEKIENVLINITKTEINNTILERDSKIKVNSTDINKDTSEKKNDNESNSIAFIIFSTLIELVILTGVYFKDYYDFRSYKEMRSEIENDPNYQKWILYNQMLKIIYTEDTKINQKLTSNKGIIESCKLHDIIVLPKNVIEFIKSLTITGIVKVSGSSRYFCKQRDLSIEELKKYFKIE